MTAQVGAGLTLAVMLDGCRGEPAPAGPAGAFAPDAWIRLAPDGTVTVMVDRSEMGQGISTALPMLVAEELDADWDRVRFEFAGAGKAYYNPLLQVQATGGSTSVRAAWEPLRRAGATARAMLIVAAAARWQVPAAECETEPGRVVHRGSGREAGYGDLASAASLLAIPAAVPLKEPARYRLIGRPVPRLDIPSKVNGSAEFGLDAGPRDALVALVARCPVFGGRMVSFDAAPALAVDGVRLVIPIDAGVAVVADNFWAAKRGRDALQVTWDEGDGARWSDATVRQHLTDVLAGDLRRAREVGTPAVGRTIEATYDVPFLAHATMEPMNCTADVRADGATVWVPTQFQAGPAYLAGGGVRSVAAKVAGVSASAVEVHTTHLGGGFGRRFELDTVREAVAVAKAAGRPVRLVWTREDDVRHDYYRTAARHHVVATVDGAGNPLGWDHRIAAQSILARFVPGFVPDWMAHLAGPLKGGIDPSAVEGAVELPYQVGYHRVGYAEAHTPVPVGYWRSVGHSHTAFVVESFVDELAEAAGRDPVEYRRVLLAGSPRHRTVLDLAAERAGWGRPLPEGRFHGVAVHESFGSWVAQVAEVSVTDRRIRVHRVTCAVDCGRVINPDTVRAQLEGGIVFGLSAALSGRISLENGRVRQSNFHDYQVLRMADMPVIEVHLVESGFEPGGVGEPGTPPIAAAVANAVARATGKRLRSLPLDPTA
ncbi:MAG: molybdopterin cofactor-binding domain-containing protein [Gemmatimonadales bacterium]